MTDAEAFEMDALWADFHNAVNMTSQELAAWLRVSSAGEDAERLPERAGSERGRGVLAILRKRQMDLTDADIDLMREVVETVTTERAAGPREERPEPDWRYQLMSLGHDPLRAG
ncbi:DUF3140 domain-containing protein [Streptomyces sp. 3MP-14]|uniref:DUF3140 domain-containing protein n=1 Tax=Streptomyces mimosae TaxID=2586635 RepID=A0A5N6AFE2_9ACTN|nr:MULTISPECIES: DUF3140 domain-containing protein [Streptomyces]KAB8166509.1 DUF3140 domain-containing protein [Streptomyces mimosae]KAB8178938.1 DUF3140 domain-containing protein [Streptomyces sp. 3MP-14]